MESPSAALRWIEALTKQPPSTPDATLCDYLRDGRVLCMLANALSETNEVRVRSPDRFRTYHALESVSLFLRWARDRASIGDNAMFTSAQLIDEQDEVAVLACLRALEAKYRSKSGGVIPAKIADTTVTPDVVPPTKTTPPFTPSVVKEPVEASKTPVSTTPTKSTTPTTLPSSPTKESIINVVERIQQTDPLPVQADRVSPRRSPSPKQNSPTPRATPSPANNVASTPAPPNQPSPTAPTTTSPKAPVLSKSKSKLASFLASTPATATPATIHKAPPQPLSRLASLSSASDVSVEGSRIEQAPSPTVAPVVDPIPPVNVAAPEPVAAADAAADTTTTASQSPPRQRNKIASAYLAAIESSTPSMPPSPRRSPSPKRVSSPKSTASPPTEPKTFSKLHAFTSGSSFKFSPTQVDAQFDTSVDAPEPSISPKATVTTSFREYEPLATTASPKPASSDIVLTIPSLQEAGFDFAWSRESNSVVILLHQEPMWPHLTLSSINGVLLTKNGRLSLAEWRRAFQELSGPFECRFHPTSQR